MNDRFLDPALEQLAELLSNLTSACDLLKPLGAHLAAVDRLEEEIAGVEEEVLSELADAGLASHVEELEEQRSIRVPVSSQVGASVMEYLSNLQELMASAAQLASGVPDMVEDTCRQAVAALEERRTLLSLLRKKAVETLEQRKKELAAASHSYEETLPFDQKMKEDEAASETDRRKHPRDRVSLAVRLEGENRLLSGSTENMGPGGLFAVSGTDLELGTLVHVECTLPDGTLVEADGVVAWKREANERVVPGVGIEFLALSEDGRRVLEQVYQQVP